MKNLFLSIFILPLIFFASCDNIEIGCEYYEEPSEAEIILHLTINEIHDSVPVVFYLGDVEDRDTLLSFIATSEEEGIIDLVDYDYSTEATYIVNGKEVKVIDGDFLNLKYDEDSDCWNISGDHHWVQLIYEDEIE